MNPKPESRPMAEEHRWVGDDGRPYRTEATGTWVWYESPDGGADFVTATREEAVPQLRRELLRVVAKLAAKEREIQGLIESWEEREAACCPEDVGFEEYIGSLQKDRDDWQTLATENLQWKALAGKAIELVKYIAQDPLRGTDSLEEKGLADLLLDPDGLSALRELEELRTPALMAPRLQLENAKQRDRIISLELETETLRDRLAAIVERVRRAAASSLEADKKNLPLVASLVFANLLASLEEISGKPDPGASPNPEDWPRGVPSDPRPYFAQHPLTAEEEGYAASVAGEEGPEPEHCAGCPEASSQELQMLADALACVEMAIDEAESLPQEGGAEATILEQLDGARSLLQVLFLALKAGPPASPEYQAVLANIAADLAAPEEPPEPERQP